MTAWAEAVVEGDWVRPARGGGRREPRWGHPGGLQLGLHPSAGPRGLVRVFTPYVGQARERLLNFVAVEPIPLGQDARGFSELERSRLDDMPGLRMWSADDPDDPTPRDPCEPSRGHVSSEHGVDRLVVHLGVERFANGADVVVTATFRADRPHEVTFSMRTRPGSAGLEACILTATMGNYARLRVLRLAGRDVLAGELWPDYADHAFADHAAFGIEELPRDGAAVVVRAEPDEADPVSAVYDATVSPHWRYEGGLAAQSWRVDDPHPRMRAQVNGRVVYWASEAPIPGGIAFENVEVVEPFREGASFTFAVDPLPSSSGG